MLIKIDKKAATAADVNLLLEQSYALADPFGIPTLTLQPNDYQDCAQGKRSLVKALKSTIHDYVNKMDIQASSEAKDLVRVYNKSLKRRYEDILRPWMEAKAACFMRYTVGVDQDFPSGTDTLCNIVFAYDNDMTWTKTAQAWFPETTAKYMPDFSLYEAHFKLMSLWHEYAHGTGAWEPQAEKMAAIVTRKYLQSPAFLQFRADMRAFAAVLYESDVGLDEYGWPMVEVIDSVLQMPQDQIDDAYDEETIKELRKERFDHQVADVFAVRARMQKHIRNFAYAWPEEVEEFASYIVRWDKSLNSVQKGIACRFALAAGRLSKGPKAYEVLADKGAVPLAL